MRKTTCLRLSRSDTLIHAHTRPYALIHRISIVDGPDKGAQGSSMIILGSLSVFDMNAEWVRFASVVLVRDCVV